LFCPSLSGIQTLRGRSDPGEIRGIVEGIGRRFTLMVSEDHPMTEEALFDLAVDTPEADRAALLDRECRGNPALRARVEGLLGADALPDPTLTHPGERAGDRTASYSPPIGAAGVVVGGKYKLVEPIGEGGMGSVWLAHQTEPVKRKVAVKLIKAGMDSKAVIARFEAERQALAVMDHPNIAKVLDGGLHEHRPYFVMELVKGVPITEYCDKLKLTPKERLELFVQVCQAIQHAHQKGIIHRDIKPSNVLIALYDDKPVVKVIDFGVAKATGGALTEKTIDTGFGGVVGTPQYMSPEQATFNNLDIDTRSDVYSLGVLLYELLAGSPPFARKELEKRGLLEILRVVREEEPPRPSTKLSTNAALPSLSASRGTEPKKLTGLLRNELDWVVMKALEKDRTRRYETANGFAADVLRYLGGEAVQAHPPSAGYRLKKFVRRNKGQVIAASLVLCALVMGVVGTTWQAIRAENARLAEAEQRQLAEANETKAVAAAAAEKAANVQAQTRLTQIEKGNEIITSIFTDLDIHKVKEGTEPLEAVLAKRLVAAAGQLEGEAVGDPLAVAGLQDRLGQSLLSLGHAQDAIPLFVKARETRTAKLGADHPYTLTSMNNLAEGYQAAGKLDLALPLLEETLKLKKAKLGADHPDTLGSMNNLAAGYHHVGKLDLALPLYEETLKLTKAKLGADHPDTLGSMNNLATGYQAAGKLDLALPLYEETLKLIKAKLGADHLSTLTSMNNLAEGYRSAGKLNLALPLYEETLKLTKAKLGADHPDTLGSMNNLALGYHSAGKLDLALPLYEETLKLRKAKLGADHPQTLTSMGNLASGYKDAGKLDLALPLLEETLKLMKAKLGADHPHTLAAKSAMEFVRAILSAEVRYRAKVAEVGPRHIDALLARRDLAQMYMSTNRIDDAELILVEVLQGMGDREPNDAIRAFTIGLLGRCLVLREKKQPDDWRTFNTQSLLGGALLGQKKYVDAEPLLLKGYEGMKQREKTIPPQAATRLPEALDRLIELTTATKKPDEAKKWRAEREKSPSPLGVAPLSRERK
jgi:serine/threonine protein kinase